MIKVRFDCSDITDYPEKGKKYRLFLKKYNKKIFEFNTLKELYEFDKEVNADADSYDDGYEWFRIIIKIEEDCIVYQVYEWYRD